MKVILVWDPRFLAQKPARLMLDDQLASACVRAGVAAAADPAEQAGLAAGPPLDPGNLGDAIVQHGPAKRPVRIVLPASVIAVGVGLGIAAPAAGPPIGGGTPAPVFSANPSISPTSGDTSTIFTATDGPHNGTSLTRRWLLNGTAIGTGTTIVTGAGNSGSLVLENTASGPGGTTTVTSSAVTVTAAPSPLITSINAEGWSGEYRVPGDLPAMTTTLPSEMAPDGASPKLFLVDRAGFTATGSATTYTETRIITKRKRQPYPNYTLAEPASIVLDDYVYSTDTITGVVNNSTVLSPKPVAAWAMPARLLVGNSVHWEIVAFHRDFRSNRQVACVRVRANNGTTQTAWQTVAATAISATAEDANPIEAFQGDLDITALATGDFWLEGEVYPWIGDTASVLKSEDAWAASASPRKFTRRHFRKDVARAATPPLAYVASTGNDTTGVWSTNAASAAASPFLTLSGAHKALAGAAATGGIADGCRIRIVDNVAIGANTITANTQGGACPIVERAPGTARASALLTMAARYTPVMTCSIAGLEPNVIMYDMAIDRTANSNSGFYGASSSAMIHVQLWNVRVKDASGTFGSHLVNAHQSIFGAVFDAATTNWVWLTNSASYELRLFRGVVANIGTAQPVQWITIGCTITGGRGPVMQTPTDGCIVYNNKFLARDGQAAAISISATNAGDLITGSAIIQNLVEITGLGTNPAVTFSADNANGSTAHTNAAHNTIAGFVNSRLNGYYDESTGTNRRTHYLIRMWGNIWVQANTKGDRFQSTTDPTEAPNRTGNFAYMNGVGCGGEWTQFCSADGAQAGSAFSQMHPGLRASIGTSLTVRNDPLFVNYQGTVNASTAGAGGGDYRLQAGSGARGRVTKRGLAFDLAGAARPTSGNDSCGAYA